MLHRFMSHRKRSKQPQTLYGAIRDGDEAFVRRHYADPDNLKSINETDAVLEQTILHRAACYGHENVCLALVALGADRNARDKSGKRPYEIARLCDYIGLKHILSPQLEPENKPHPNHSQYMSAEQHERIAYFVANGHWPFQEDKNKHRIAP